MTDYKTKNQQTKTETKFYAVCPSGNTDADTVLRFPDRESAQLACDIWKVAHPGTYPYTRETRMSYSKEYGRSYTVIELQ